MSYLVEVIADFFDVPIIDELSIINVSPCFNEEVVKTLLFHEDTVYFW
jgi:hypothetical protein